MKHISNENQDELKVILLSDEAFQPSKIEGEFLNSNGRIGRALSEKVLSQYLEPHTLIALSHIIENNKKLYYRSLEPGLSHLLFIRLNPDVQSQFNGILLN